MYKRNSYKNLITIENEKMKGLSSVLKSHFLLILSDFSKQL